MPFKKALSDKQEEALVVDYEDGFKPAELARRYGVSDSTVQRILGDHQMPIAQHPRRKRKVVRAKKPLKPCGTNAAYQRHRRKGEYPCTPCLEAHAAEQKSWAYQIR